MSKDDLHRRFGIPGRVEFGTCAGAELVTIDGALAKAVIALKGGHVLSYVPKGQADVLWLSPVATVAGPGPIRGGIPVCWPWFADHPQDTGAPAHGFARTATWQMCETAVQGLGEVRLVLSTSSRPEHRRWFAGSAEATLTIVVGQSLSLTLETCNVGTAPFALTQALHSYFRVGDIARASVGGLDVCAYLDKTDAFARKRQAGPVVVDREVDRIYVGTAAETVIEDPVLGRRIRIAKEGSTSTVVWNPWAERATRMGDLGPNGWRSYLCVETANAGDDVVTLAPASRHRLRAVISSESPIR